MRRRHLAGAALFGHAPERRWIVKAPATRVRTVTGTGRTASRGHLGLPDDVLSPSPALLPPRP
ncbi:hypothetical protein [Streptomyces sp. x-80]|uniref:hypothetical protein n=1 Tax=Streptomyces sp. x-80 TaxID=2789282 RepID=UPI00397F9A9E